MVNADERNDDGIVDQPGEAPVSSNDASVDEGAAAKPKRQRAPRASAAADGAQGEAKPKRVRAGNASPASEAGAGDTPKPVRRRKVAAEEADATAGEQTPVARRRKAAKAAEVPGEQLTLLAEVAGTPVEPAAEDVAVQAEPVPAEAWTANETTIAAAPADEVDDAVADGGDGLGQAEVAWGGERVEEEPTAARWEDEVRGEDVVLGREMEAVDTGADTSREEAGEVDGGWVVTPVSRGGTAGWATTTGGATGGWNERGAHEEAEDSRSGEVFATEPRGEWEGAEEYRDGGQPPWAAEAEEREEHHHRVRAKTVIRELVETGLLALLVFLSVKASFQNFKVDGLSMSPTLHNGQFLIVNKLVYSELDMAKVGDFVPFVSGGEDPTRYVFHGPQRGDIIVLMDPRNPSQDLIKRVIGLPGETIEIVDGKVYINGYRLDEPYIKTEWHDTKARITIPAGEYFVMGDNRNNSLDSRFDSVGMIPKELIIGKALLSYWPKDQFGLAPNSPGTSGGPTLTDERVPQNGRTQGSSTGR